MKIKKYVYSRSIFLSFAFVFVIISFAYFKSSSYKKNQLFKKIKEADVIEAGEYETEKIHAEYGQISFYLTIESLGIIDEPVWYGCTKENMFLGLCMIEKDNSSGWQMPLEKGRCCITGHNGGALKKIYNLNEENLNLYLRNGNMILEYVLEKSRIVENENWEKEAYFDTPDYGLTIYTCYPYVLNADKSWVLNCSLVSVRKGNIK